MMRIPSEKVSASVIRELSRYTIARLKADPRTAPLAEGVASARDAVLAATTARDSTRDLALDAMAARDQADRLLDQAVIKASLTLLASVGNRRDDPTYTRFFPGGATAITRLPLADEVAAVKLLAGRLAEEPAGSPAVAFRDSLKAAGDTLEAALVAYRTTLLNDQAARAREIEARQDWRRTYQKLYADVLVATNGQRADAESYFKPATSAATEIEATPPVA